jgi:hypothetical protein
MNSFHRLFSDHKDARARRLKSDALIAELEKADAKLQLEIEILQGCKEMIQHYGQAGTAMIRLIDYHTEKGRKKRSWVNALEREAIRRGIGWKDLTEGRTSLTEANRLQDLGL